MPQLTERDLNQQLDQELFNFTNSIYTGEIPSGFINIFKDALFHASPRSHQIHVQSIRKLLEKKESELVVGEVGSMTKVLLDTPLDWVFADFGDAIDYLEKLEALTVEYNRLLAEFKTSLDKKKASMMKLIEPGRRGGGNGMQIIK